MENPEVIVLARFNPPILMHCCTKHCVKCECQAIYSINGNKFLSVHQVGWGYVAGSSCQIPLQSIEKEQKLLRKGGNVNA